MFAFEASAGTVVTIDIDAEAIGSDFDSVLILYDEYGYVVESNDDSDGRDSYIEAYLSEGGTYYIKVESYDHSSSGSYRLRVYSASHH